MEALSERDTARMATNTLHALARQCHAMFQSKRTRLMISHLELHYHRLLDRYADSLVVLDDSTRRAWLEWDEEARALAADEAVNPDLLLEWLDLYPKMVISLYLRSLDAEYSPKPAQTPEKAKMA